MTIATDERGFLEAIQLAPRDDTPRLVYADWLEEQGDERAEYVRAEVELQRLKGESEPPRSRLPELLRRFARRPRSVDEVRSRLHALGERLDSDWIAALARVPIENRRCEDRPVRFAFECPLRWENLERTDDPTVRHCQTCSRPVQFCKTVEAAREHAGTGTCVAIDIGCERFAGDLDVFTGGLLGEIA